MNVKASNDTAPNMSEVLLGQDNAENVVIPAVVLDKKALSQAKLDFNLHVALIMRQDSANKNAALFKAWLEGRDGLQNRLSPR